MQGKAVEMTSKNAKKWKQYKFKNPKMGMMRLTYITSYCVDSIVKGVAYLADADNFAIIRTEGFLVCKIHEMPELAKELAPVFRQEVLDIYEDIKDLKLMEVIYG